jgi:hypothetical protein
MDPVSILGIALFGAMIGWLCGTVRGRPGEAAALGSFLGPIGWLLILCGPDKRPKCGECGGVVVAGARKCQNCGSVIGRFAVQSRFPGVGLKCPACGEIGFVKEVDKDTQVECPACRRTFAGAGAIVE